MEVASFGGGIFTLHLPMPYDIAVGDTYEAVPGCRKRRSEDCNIKFNNVVNFRGFPDVPSTTRSWATPRRRTRNDATTSTSSRKRARGSVCRWAHQGSSRDGVDCAGLVIEVAKAVRGSTFDKTDYPRMATDETMLQLCAQHLGPVSRDRMQPGDLAVFAFDRQRHVAILGDYVFGGLSLIHAYAPARKVVEMRLDERWRSRLLAAFRFPEAA
jgi:hypothetical protein